MTRGDIPSAALAILLVLGPTNIVSDDEFPWPGSAFVPPTLAQCGRGVTETFPYEAGTLAGYTVLHVFFK